MPPFKPVVSKSQSRALFAKARRGDGISIDDAKGKTKAANFAALPDRKVKRGKRAKTAPRRASRY